MKTFAMYAVGVLAALTLKLQTHAQSLDPAFIFDNEKAETKGMVITFKDQTPNHQHYILQHPEFYRVASDGMVEVKVDHPQDLEEPTRQVPATVTPEKAGTSFPLVVKGLVDHEGPRVFKFRITSQNVMDEKGGIIAEIEDNSLTKFMERLKAIQTSPGINGLDIDPAYSNVTLTVAGITSEMLLEELQNVLEDRK